MDGLLFDTERLGFKAYKKAMEERGYPFSMDVYKRLIGAGQLEDEMILKEVYGESFELAQITSTIDGAFNQIIEEEGIRVMSGVHELLDALDEMGIQKCIASSSSIARIEQYLALTNLTHRFDFYMSGDEVDKGKPHPDIFIEACRRANVKPDDALVLEDSLNGLRAAKSASIKCIIIPDLIDENDEMRKDAYHITAKLDNLVQLVGV